MADTTPVIINSYPTPKEQVIAGTIALGFTALTAVALIGGAALAGKAHEKWTAWKNRKQETVVAK